MKINPNLNPSEIAARPIKSIANSVKASLPKLKKGIGDVFIQAGKEGANIKANGIKNLKNATVDFFPLKTIKKAFSTSGEALKIFFKSV